MSRRSESGFTLVELLVVLVIMGVVGGVVTSAIMTSMRSASATSARIQATQELEIAMQRMTRDIRAADPLELSPSGDFANEVGARVSRGGSSKSVMYYLAADGSELHARTVQLDDTGAEVSGTPSRQLVAQVDNGGTPVFTYLDASGRELSCVPDCVTAYRGVAQIQIRLTRHLTGDTQVVLDSHVNVRSVRYRSES